MPPSEEEIIIAAFRREDVVRLHTLLSCYESPYRTTDELFAQEALTVVGVGAQQQFECNIAVERQVLGTVDLSRELQPASPQHTIVAMPATTVDQDATTTVRISTGQTAPPVLPRRLVIQTRFPNVGPFDLSREGRLQTRGPEPELSTCRTFGSTAENCRRAFAEQKGRYYLVGRCWRKVRLILPLNGSPDGAVFGSTLLMP